MSDRPDPNVNLPVLNTSANAVARALESEFGERRCGTCTLCCKALAVAALKKPAGVLCRHCTPAKGCNIHDSRPYACRTFYCLWLQGCFDDDHRPDNIDVFFYFDHTAAYIRGPLGKDDLRIIYYVGESYPGALLMNDRARKIASRILDSTCIMIHEGERFKVLRKRPDGRIEVAVTGRPGESMRYDPADILPAVPAEPAIARGVKVLDIPVAPE